MNARQPLIAMEDDEAPTRAAPVSFGPLSGIVGFHIARAAVTTYRAFETFIGKPFELKKVEFSLLMVVQANGALPPKRLARTLAVTASTSPARRSQSSGTEKAEIQKSRKATTSPETAPQNRNFITLALAGRMSVSQTGATPTI